MGFYCLLNTPIVKFLKPKLSKVLRFMANTHCHYSERAFEKSLLYLFPRLCYTGVQWKGTHFLSPPGGLLLHLQQLWRFQFDSLIDSPRRLDFLTASPKEKSCNSTEDGTCQHQDKISWWWARLYSGIQTSQKKREKNPKTQHPRDILFQDLTAKASYSSEHCRNFAVVSWHVGRHGGGSWLLMKWSK